MNMRSVVKGLLRLVVLVLPILVALTPVVALAGPGGHRP